MKRARMSAVAITTVAIVAGLFQAPAHADISRMLTEVRPVACMGETVRFVTNIRRGSDPLYESPFAFYLNAENDDDTEQIVRTHADTAFNSHAYKRPGTYTWTITALQLKPDGRFYNEVTVGEIYVKECSPQYLKAAIKMGSITSISAAGRRSSSSRARSTWCGTIRTTSWFVTRCG